MMKQPSQIGAEAILIFTTAIWGSTFFIIKILVGGANLFSPFALLSLRFSIATIVAFFVFMPKRLPNRKETIGALIIGISGFAGYAFQTIGLVHTTAAKSGFITSLFVLFIPFLSIVWEKVKIPLNVYIALIPAIFGLWAISGVGRSIGALNPGDAMTLLSAFSYTFQVVSIQVYTSKYDWKLLTVMHFAVMMFGSFVGAIIEPNSLFVWNANSILAVGSLAIIATVGALGVQMFAQRFTTSSRASLVYLSEPIFAALFAWLFINEMMTTTELIGAGAILASIFIGRMPEKKK